jgi:hypothetical protein
MNNLTLSHSFGKFDAELLSLLMASEHKRNLEQSRQSTDSHSTPGCRRELLQQICQF